MLAALSISIIVAGLFIADYYEQASTKDYVQMTRAIHQLILSEVREQQSLDKETLITTFENQYPFKVAFKPRTDLSATIQEALDLQGVHVELYTSLSNDRAVVTYPSNDNTYTIQLEPAVNFNQPYNVMLIIVLLFVLLGFAIALMLAIKPIKSHVNKLSKVSNAIGSGDFSTRANEHAPSPLDSLAKSINTMADQLMQLLEDKKVFMSASAHELRTPLARIRFALDLMQSVEDKQQLKQQLSEMEVDVTQLEQLVEELLAYSRLSFGEITLRPVAINVLSELEHIVDHLAPLNANKTVVIQCPENASFVADSALFGRCLSNLVKNAKRYARERVEISVQVTETTIRFTIDDDGPGVNEANYPNLVRAFYRVDESRSLESGGSGLGLSIANNIMNLHKGSLYFSRSILGGLRVTLHWPLTNADYS